MSGLIGRKIGMTSIFDENEEFLYSNGSWYVLLTGEPKVLTVVLILKTKHSTKAALGHFKKSGNCS
jgi:ribosomal protein L3